MQVAYFPEILVAALDFHPEGRSSRIVRKCRLSYKLSYELGSNSFPRIFGNDFILKMEVKGSSRPMVTSYEIHIPR
jgi:hypothetical protein